MMEFNAQMNKYHHQIQVQRTLLRLGDFLKSTNREALQTN